MRSQPILWLHLTCCLALISPVVLAEPGALHGKVIKADESLGFIKNAYLTVENQVGGLCWTNVDQVKQRAKLTLERIGISVYEEPLFITSPFSTNIVITGLGLRSGDGVCFGNIEIRSFREIFYDFGGASIKYHGSNYVRNSVALSGSNLNASFLSAVDTFISEFSADVFVARKNENVANILKKEDDTNPITMRWIDELFKPASKE